MYRPATTFRVLTLLCGMCGSCYQPVNAQKTQDYEAISTTQGLSQGMVFDILQDKDGFLWIATKNGLNRYDGYTFKVFSNDPYDVHSLSSNTILKLLEDKKGRIWAGTEDGGLNIFDKSIGKFYRVVHQPTDPASLSANSIRLMLELEDGRVLAVGDGAGFNVVELNESFFAKDAAPVVTRLSLPDNVQVYGMAKDKKGTVFIGGMDGSVYQFDALKNSFKKVENGSLLNNGYFSRDGSILINNNLFLSDGKNVVPLFDTEKQPPGNIIFRPRQKLWENFHRELYFYDVSKWEAGKRVQWDLRLPDSTRLMYPFITDRSGMLWSGSVGYGLRKYNIGGTKFRPLIVGSVRWIKPLQSDDIFIGNYAYGWFRFKNDSVENNGFSHIPSVTQIDNFIITKKGDYWLKSDNKGYFNYDPFSGKLISHPEINSGNGVGDKQPMLEDSKGYAWFPGLGGIFIRYHFATRVVDSININTNPARPILPKAICTALYEDKEGIFWIGTQEGFASLSIQTQKGSPTFVKWYYNNSNSRNSLNYNHVSCFMDDPAKPADYLWICTKGGGLNRLNKHTGDFIHLTSKEGLPDDVVYGILPDNAGNIWGSTNNGIFCLSSNTTHDTTQWTFRNFSKAYGLQGDEFNTGAFAKLPDGKLAFGGVNGLNIFNPTEILAATFIPDVFITSIMVNNLPLTAGDKTGVLTNTIESTEEITLNHLQDILTLEFSSLDFTAPAQNKYRYRLEGIDKEWVESGTRRSATYLHLPPGKYIFKVQGSNSQGIWSNKIAQLRVNVLPPWWRTWFAYGAYILLFLLGIRAYLKFSLNRAKLRSQLNFEQQEAKRIKELDTVKTQFYTNITHEFRTPLTVILGMAQQVIDKPGEHLNNGIDMIMRNGQHLLNLVNEILDLSKLETGKMQLHKVDGDIINFLRYIVESFHSLAESKQKQLHFATDMDALYVAYDPEKIRQIVANLLSNALKFTPENGQIYINVSRNTPVKNEWNVKLIIKVKDTGIGIPAGHHQHIFDRFYQLDNSHTRKAEGTGIGLALTKELVKLMEGEITVKSPPVGSVKGSEFTVILPMVNVLPPGERTAYPIVQEVHQLKRDEVPAGNGIITGYTRGTECPLVLVVEDNEDVVAYISSCLPDYRLAVGRDGREGFEIAKEKIPDLVITDVMMPFVDGYELCRMLRKNDLTSHIPIIMLTAKADLQSKIEGLQHGADVYLEKPFHREELLVRIKKLLELRRNLQSYYLGRIELSSTTPGAALPADVIIVDTKTEDEFVKKVKGIIEMYLSDRDFTVEQLCKKVFISHSQLHRKLEALTGCTPNKFIRMIRLNNAKELMKNPANSIASVAIDCGYNDPGYFSRVFKQEYGITPQEWRVK